MEREKIINSVKDCIDEFDNKAYYSDFEVEKCARKIISTIIHEDAVVLTQDEYDKLNRRIAFSVTYDEEKLKEFVNEAISNVQIQIEEIRKETAKDIYRELYLNSFKDEKMFYPTFENWAEVLRKYGVEVKE